MTDVPKIVRERLKAGVATDTHPDANVLTAFTERSLPESERVFVLQHLARCGQCREIMSLALPEDASIPVLAPARSGGWLAWPTLRWAFVAAGIIVIASLGTVQYRRQERASSIAYKAPTPSFAVKEAENKAIATPVPPNVSNPGKQEVPKAPSKPTETSPRVSPATARNSLGRTSIGGPLSHGPRVLNQFQQQNANIQQQQNTNGFLPQSAAAAPPPVAFARPDANQQPQAATSSKAIHGDVARTAPTAQNGPALTVQSESVTQQTSTYEIAQNNVERAKPADDLHLSASRKVPAGSPVQFDTLARKAVPAPRWTINSSGALQRSYDQGNTWQDVDVNVAAGVPAPESSLLVPVEKSRAEAKDVDVTLAKKSASPVFRAVAANGSDVWAGGSSGMLYHSVDSGIHWTRIIPTLSGSALTGDVIALDFPDPQHGKVTTSTSEVWITSDSGQTWQKQ